ncbi:class I SAM-dependent methyltransferase [Desulfonatronospira sp.]|uniref:class I SAM-dependent methyltransferase n=1 Tax=Desulfonatronospira sp. TaxID=1962951 RepID=UPI0025C2E9DC|nr:class I SAM-dependent methyltransferase [Desulfonatronospira sp.]
MQSEPALVWMDYSPAQELDWLLQNCSAQKILLITNPKILMNASALQRLSRLLDRGYAACGPVFNLTGLQKQQADLPAVYLNLSTYEEILQLMAHEPGLDSVRVDRLDPACVLFARSYLQGLDQKIRLKEMALQAADSSAGSMAVELKSLVHNFGDYFSAQRDDLIRLAPLECRRVLDVGCAAGEYGKGLKEKIPEAEVIGIELDADMAGLAAAHYRHVLVQQVQEVEFAEPFDLINCGDVLEHLQDPWTVLDKLYSLLARQGILVISLPNAGHWTIVRDLLQGRFEYVPWGLLCITHVRWFTEESIRKALEDAGFEIEVFDRQQIEPTPQGKEFIQKMIEQGYGDETSLLSNEFLIRARRK